MRKFSSSIASAPVSAGWGRSFTPAAIAGLLTAWSSAASAHITLISPQPRYTVTTDENKACPCGEGTSNRRCEVASERSDPNRAMDRVTTLRAGQELVVRFNETVGHPGRYRIAFDDNGADLDDFNANILEDIPDPAGREGNIGDGSMWEIPITVPDTPCTNCTLQLIQMMDGNTTSPVPDPVGRSSYYQCADIVIVAADDSEIDDGSDSEGGGPGGIADAGADDDDPEDAPEDVDPPSVSSADSSGMCSIGEVSPKPWQSVATLPLLISGLLLGWRRRSR